MKILIYGAGPLGSIFAAKLHQGGHDISILARGQRLADLREHGIMLHNVATGQQSTTHVPTVEALHHEDRYDLVIVIMRKNNALDILPVLAANRHTPNILFLMNNAAGPAALVEALGRDRVLVGFPNAAGYREGPVVHGIVGTEEQPSKIPFGEVDGQVRERTLQVAEALECAPGLGAEIRTDMDAWLKYHVALLMPSLAPALYMSGTDNYRMARTRDAIVLAIRAIQEGFRVLKALGYPVTPARYKIITWLPEPLLIAWMQRLLNNPMMEVAMVRHANAARDEVKHLADEFLVLARQSKVPTPAIDRLYPHLDPETPTLPEGSQEIPLNWRGVWAGIGTLIGLIGIGILIGKVLKGKKG